MKWLYKDTLATGILIELEDEADYKRQGYVDTPDDYVDPSEVIATELQDMDKSQLKEYAKTTFGVTLDLRKNHNPLVREVQALEDGIK